MVKRGKSMNQRRKLTKKKQKYGLFFPSELRCCSTVRGQGSGAVLQVLSRLLLKSFTHSVAWDEEPGFTGREGHAYVTGPVTANSWPSPGLQRRSLCGSWSRFHVSVSEVQRADGRTKSPPAMRESSASRQDASSQPEQKSTCVDSSAKKLGKESSDHSDPAIHFLNTNNLK